MTWGDWGALLMVWVGGNAAGALGAWALAEWRWQRREGRDE